MRFRPNLVSDRTEEERADRNQMGPDEAWAEINEVVRSLGGKWQKGNTPKDGAWRIPK